MRRDFLSRQFVLFLLTGGFAALVNFCSRLLYSQFSSFSTAVILAYLTGMVTAFILSKLFVFKGSSHSTLRSAVYFSLVNLLAIIQTWLVSMGMAYYLLPAMGIEYFVEELAHLAGVMVPVITSFLGHKYFSFREEPIA